jgi:hypothetical protein
VGHSNREGHAVIRWLHIAAGAGKSIFKFNGAFGNRGKGKYASTACANETGAR